MPLKNLAAHYKHYTVRACATRPLMKTMPDDKNQQKKYENAEEDTTKKYIPLPVRRKRNAFANRVGKRASIMRNQYCVNVPVDGNIYVKKKNKELKKPESGKRKQQQPLMSHFINHQPTGNKRQLPMEEDEVHSTRNHSKKRKHEPTINKPTTNQLTANNQANSKTANNQPNQQPTLTQARNQLSQQLNHQPTMPTTMDLRSKQSPTNQTKNKTPANSKTNNQPI